MAYEWKTENPEGNPTIAIIATSSGLGQNIARGRIAAFKDLGFCVKYVEYDNGNVIDEKGGDDQNNVEDEKESKDKDKAHANNGIKEEPLDETGFPSRAKFDDMFPNIAKQKSADRISHIITKMKSFNCS